MKEIIGIRIEPEERKKLEKLANESGHTISSYVRWLLEKDFRNEAIMEKIEREDG